MPSGCKYLNFNVIEYYIELERQMKQNKNAHGDTDYFDIVVGVLQGDTLAPYLFIICLA